jgi:hypothetical protein
MALDMALRALALTSCGGVPLEEDHAALLRAVVREKGLLVLLHLCPAIAARQGHARCVLDGNDQLFDAREKKE